MTEHEDGRQYPHDADNHVRIYEDEPGRMWVTHEELLLCGYINISDFDVVYLNGKFYELQAHANKPDSWWIEEIPIGEEAETQAYSPETSEANRSE